nr:hypothetical protein [Tanacetum cinerariifolium]
MYGDPPRSRLIKPLKLHQKSSHDENDDEESENANNDDHDDDNANKEDDDNEQTESDNDADDFVHPKLSTFDEYERDEEKLDEEEEGSNQRFHTPSHFESTDDKAYDESSSVSSGFISKMLNPNPDIGIDSIFNLYTESTSLVYFLVTTDDEIPPSPVTTLPLPPILLIQHVQQTPASTPTIAPSTSLQNLPTFGSLFKFEDKMNEAVKATVQLQSYRLREEAHAEREEFINKIDENIKKIIEEQVKVQLKEQVFKILPRIKKSVSEQLKAKVLIHSSNEAKTSRAVASNLSKLKLKKILIDKMENNKLIDILVQQKTLFKTLVDAYESDKDILSTYGDTATLKRRRDDENDNEEPSAGSNRGSKRRRAKKEPESSSEPKEKSSKSTGKSKEGFKSHQKCTGKSAQAEEPIHTVEDLEELAHQEFETGFTEDHPVEETTPLPDCTLARNQDPRESFNELMHTPLDFSAFVLNQLKVDTLTPEPESSSEPKEKSSKSTGKSKEGFKSHQKCTGKSAQAEEPIHTVEDLEELAYQEFETGFTEDHPVEETTPLPDWFQKPSIFNVVQV